MFIVAIIGALTAIFAATIGLAQNDIKKVLAYSTCLAARIHVSRRAESERSVAAIFHVMTHAFFKALLFLGSGSVIHGMHHEQDMRKMGNLRKYMPITFITMMAGWLAICGIPIWAGFFSKDEILYKTFATHNIPEPWNYVLWIIGLITAVLTAVYMTRMMWMTFFGEERFQLDLHESDGTDETHGTHTSHDSHSSDDDDEEEHHALPPNFHPHESPWTMTVPLVVLAVLSTVGGLVGIPYALSGGAVGNVFERTLEPVIAKVGKKEGGHEAPAAKPHAAVADPQLRDLYASAEAPKLVGETAEVHEEHSPEALRTERLLAGLSVLLALSGIAIGVALFGKNPLLKMPKILEDKWRIDEFYNGYIVDPITNLSREGLWKGFRSRIHRRDRQRHRVLYHRAWAFTSRDPGWIRTQLRGDHPARSSRGAWIFYLLRFEVSWLVVRCSLFVGKLSDTDHEQPNYEQSNGFYF
jgi:NADH-quinone oxidoreductase subunit L